MLPRLVVSLAGGGRARGGLRRGPWEGGRARGAAVNGVKPYQPSCRTAEERARSLETATKASRRSPRRVEEGGGEKRDPVDEFLRQHPELEVFGREWVGRWLYVGERLAELAKALRRHPWMAEALRQRRVVNPSAGGA